MIEKMEKINLMPDIEQEVRKLVCETLERSTMDDVSRFDELQELGMDSLNCIALIVSIESFFDIEISDEQLGLEYVNTIDHICDLIFCYLKNFHQVLPKHMEEMSNECIANEGE